MEGLSYETPLPRIHPHAAGESSCSPVFGSLSSRPSGGRVVPGHDGTLHRGGHPRADETRPTDSMPGTKREIAIRGAGRAVPLADDPLVQGCLVLIPARNEAGRVEEVVQSVLEQLPGAR